jgi:hypothetical protein
MTTMSSKKALVIDNQCIIMYVEEGARHFEAINYKSKTMIDVGRSAAIRFASVYLSLFMRLDPAWNFYHSKIKCLR